LSTLLSILSSVKEAAKEVIFVVVKIIARKKLREYVIGLVEVKVAINRGFGSLEAVGIIDFAFFWV
jgi:hypothetical protein